MSNANGHAATLKPRRNRQSRRPAARQAHHSPVPRVRSLAMAKVLVSVAKEEAPPATRVSAATAILDRIGQARQQRRRAAGRIEPDDAGGDLPAPYRGQFSRNPLHDSSDGPDGGGYLLNPGEGNRNDWFSGIVVERKINDRLLMTVGSGLQNVASTNQFS